MSLQLQEFWQWPEREEKCFLLQNALRSQVKDTLLIVLSLRSIPISGSTMGYKNVGAVTWMVYGWEAPGSSASIGGTTYCSLPDMLPSEYEQVKLDMEFMRM